MGVATEDYLLLVGGGEALSMPLFGTDNGAMENELNPIVLHVCTQCHCLEPSVNIHWIPIVSYSGELPALSLLLIFQWEYLGILKNNWVQYKASKELILIQKTISYTISLPNTEVHL